MAADSLGRDGHPQLGEFLPPTENRNRIWAGGRVEFIKPLLVGTKTQCNVTVTDIVEKQGSTGSLLFVTAVEGYPNLVVHGPLLATYSL